MIPPRDDKTTASTRELHQHLPLPGTDGETDTDLAGPFGDRDQHDIHDADTADQQTDRGNRTQQPGKHLGRSRHHADEFLHVIDMEVIVFTRCNAATLAHQTLDILLDFISGNAVLSRDVYGPDVRISGDAPLDGTKWQKHKIVLILAETGLALGLQLADHLAGQFFQTNGGTQSFLVPKEFSTHGGAKDTDRLAGLQLTKGKLASTLERPVPHL